MNDTKAKVELLAPAGDIEKLKFACDYGADAVYIGAGAFGLRTSSKNFDFQEMKEGIDYAHQRGVKVYLTLNIFAHNDDIDRFDFFLEQIKDLDFDAFIASDAGIISMLLEKFKEKEVHLSTQASATNYKTAKFWHKQGLSRIILARELSIDEIAYMKKKIPEDLELEVFVHGAMCMSYSGRCLISNFMTGRDANRGACAQPCRWKYKIVEEKRPDQKYELVEDERGSYLFNSKDLCGAEYIPALIEAGVSSLKIEGRSKSIYYVAQLCRVYRELIDRYYDDKENFIIDEKMLFELSSVSHREYTSGFLKKKADADSHLYGKSSYIRKYDFIAIVLSYDEEKEMWLIEQRNKFEKGEKVEIIGPNFASFDIDIDEIYDEDMNLIESARHAKQKVYLKIQHKLGKNFILRRLSK